MHGGDGGACFFTLYSVYSKANARITHRCICYIMHADVLRWGLAAWVLDAVKPKNRTSMHLVSLSLSRASSPDTNAESAQSRTPTWISVQSEWMCVPSWQNRWALCFLRTKVVLWLWTIASLLYWRSRERRQDRESIDELAVRCRIDFLCHVTFFFATVFH